MDVGSTTLVVQLVDLETGRVLAVRTALNPQCAYGADIMSRVELSMRDDRLSHMIRGTVASMVEDVVCGQPVRDVVLAGNTVMHHIFCGLDVSPLTAVPFRSYYSRFRNVCALRKLSGAPPETRTSVPDLHARHHQSAPRRSLVCWRRPNVATAKQAKNPDRPVNNSMAEPKMKAFMSPSRQSGDRPQPRMVNSLLMPS